MGYCRNFNPACNGIFVAALTQKRLKVQADTLKTKEVLDTQCGTEIPCGRFDDVKNLRPTLLPPPVVSVPLCSA